MNFGSDNVFGVHPAIMDAVVAANTGTQESYGTDIYTRKAQDQLSELFGREVESFLVLNGTAANSLCLSAMTPPYGAVICHGEAHILVDECGAPELFTGGAKLIGVNDPMGKLTLESIERTLNGFIRGEHDPKPATVSITQSSELGTVYSVERNYRDCGPCPFAGHEAAHGRRALFQCAGLAGMLAGRDDLEGRR